MIPSGSDILWISSPVRAVVGKVIKLTCFHIWWGRKDTYALTASFIHLCPGPVCPRSLQDLPRPERDKDASRSLRW